MKDYLSTFDEIEMLALCFIVGIALSLMIFLIMHLIEKIIYFFNTSREQRSIDWCNKTFEFDQKAMEPKLLYIKNKYGLHGKLTCARIDGVNYFIYLDHKYIGVFNTKTCKLISG